MATVAPRISHLFLVEDTLLFFARAHCHLSMVSYYTDTHKHRGRLLILKNQARGLVGTYAMNTTWP